MVFHPGVPLVIAFLPAEGHPVEFAGVPLTTLGHALVVEAFGETVLNRVIAACKDNHFLGGGREVFNWVK